MLKKAGIVLAATAAGLLSVSPLAFAGDYSPPDNHKVDDHKGDCDCDHGKDHDVHYEVKEFHRDGGRTVQRGVINLNNVGVQAPVQVCGNRLDILSGALGILGKAKNENSNHGDCKQSNDHH